MLLVCHGLRDNGVSAPAPLIVRALERAGIAFYPIDCERPLNACTLSERFDGVLFCGGGDSDPLLYGMARRAPLHMVSGMRDQNELALCRAFFARKKPLLGICRGMQAINIALGGTLRPHIGGHAGTPHPVRLLENGPFSPCAPKEAIVNSFHHQCVGRLAAPLRPLAAAPDGVVEALFSRDAPVLAVQWHPERADTALSEAFFTAAGRMLPP